MAIIPNTLVVNSTNLGTYGLAWRKRTGWRSYPEAIVISHKAPQRVGEIFQAREESGPRLLTVTGVIQAATVAGLYTNLNEIASRMRGRMQIGFSDDARVMFGYLEKNDIGEFDPGAIVPLAPFTFVFKCPDPLRYDTAVQDINASTDLPIGTGPVKPVVTIKGVSANPTTLEVRDKDTNVVSSFTMAAALASGESWIIDSASATVQHDDGVGGITNALDDFSGEFPVLDPADADWSTSSWGQIVVTAGAPSDVDIVYQKAWM